MKTARRTMNVGNTPLEAARLYAESTLGGDLDVLIPDFNRNYLRLQKLVKAAPGIPRIKMPVIEPSDMALFQKRLQEGHLDIFPPYAQGKLVGPRQTPGGGDRWVSLGIEDGDDRDDRVDARITNIPVGKLKPTQNEIWLENMIPNMAKYGIPGPGSPILKTTVIVSKEGFILDGHHRFGQAMLVDPSLRMEALFVPLDIKTLLEIGRSYGESIGNRPKQGSLRSSLIRLAYQNPDLREDLLPLLNSSDEKDSGYMARKNLRILAEYAREILEMCEHGERLPEWAESQVSRASSDIRDIKHYLEHGD